MGAGSSSHSGSDTHAIHDKINSASSCAALTAYNAFNDPVCVKAGDFVLVLGTGRVSM